VSFRSRRPSPRAQSADADELSFSLPRTDVRQRRWRNPRLCSHSHEEVRPDCSSVLTSRSTLLNSLADPPRPSSFFVCFLCSLWSHLVSQVAGAFSSLVSLSLENRADLSCLLVFLSCPASALPPLPRTAPTTIPLPVACKATSISSLSAPRSRGKLTHPLLPLASRADSSTPSRFIVFDYAKRYHEADCESPALLLFLPSTLTDSVPSTHSRARLLCGIGPAQDPRASSRRNRELRGGIVGAFRGS
jgi:hypothetical protein